MAVRTRHKERLADFAAIANFAMEGRRRAVVCRPGFASVCFMAVILPAISEI